jgi:hypothetical protein
MALNIAKAKQQENRESPESIILSMASIKRRALKDYLIELFIRKLWLSRALIKSHPNFQNLRNHGVISA